jgi:hypothetical protein
MNRARATALAIRCIEAEIKRLAVNANLEDMYHSGIPICVEASKRRRDLREAIAVLKELVQARMKL